MCEKILRQLFLQLSWQYMRYYLNHVCVFNFVSSAIGQICFANGYFAFQLMNFI